MNQQRTGRAVLARFPDINDGEKPQATADEAKGWGLLTSSGRWISQAVSIKLLAGMTLFLLVGAVLPFFIGKDSPPASPSPARVSASTWHPRAAEAPAKATAVETETVATAIARGPAVRVAASAEQSPAPATLPATAETKRKPPAAPTVAESMMSNWVPPARADGQPETLSADANRPMAARSTEYQADARAGRWQGEPAAARFEGTIEGTKR